MRTISKTIFVAAVAAVVGGATIAGDNSAVNYYAQAQSRIVGDRPHATW